MLSRIPSRARGAVIVCFILAGLSSAARAGFTPLGQPTEPGEKNHEQIFEGVYGGNFFPVGLDFTNGDIYARRIMDFIDPSSGEGDLVPLKIIFDPNQEGDVDVTDQIWEADAIDGRASAKFATYHQEFGFFDGTTGTNYTKLFSTFGSGFSVTGSTALVNMSGRVWRWVRDGPGGMWSSKQDDNANDLDHMLTYRIERITPTGGGQLEITKYLLFFEDSGIITEHDNDFNDLVVEINAHRTIIPEPAGLGLLGLIAAAGLRRRRA